MLNRTLLLIPICVSALFAQTRRTLNLDDLGRFKDVRDAQCSPNGKEVAYVMSQTDVKDDRAGSAHIWMIGYDGTNNRQITTSEQSENSPRWSPDGKYLAFTSSRPGPARGNQIWLLPLNGGEAFQLTNEKGRIQGFEWSPDSKRLAMVIGDPDPNAPPENETAAAGGRGGRGNASPKPIVITRYHYKQDVQGYLLAGRHSYVYIYDLATKKAERLTTQKRWDESAPSWSPDGTWIAFSSNHVADPDRDPGGQLYIAEARPGSTEKEITPMSVHAGGGRGGRAEWSPDGKWIAFLAGEDKKWGAYSQEHLAIVPSDGASAPTLVKAAMDLDRGVSSPKWSPDGKSIVVYITDDRSHYPVRVPIDGGAAEPLMAKPIVVNPTSSAGGCTAVIAGGDMKYNEIYALDGWSLRQLTHANDELLAQLDLGKTEEVSFKAKDGNEVHGLLTYPVDYRPGTKVPLLLRIHGGPKGQDQHSFSFEAQYFAAHGYAVLRMNYRGSDGRGSKYQKAIAADWGDLEVKDLEAGVDGVIAMGVADPDRLGVGGWSYGGILTDYMIASDPRFKAATDGAGTAFTVSFYGTDQYIIQYDNEIGPPWTKKGWDTYVKISYPFLHADRIKTPTIFFGGDLDFNVPVQGGQQMYEALRSLGIDTELIIYPGEHHGIARPSFVRDRYQRYLAWYDKYLMNKATPSTSTAARDR
ncbi:MAG TPA: S9 family peptidase [Bryobacteraceae bacterium]|nr:S9 family peptidase [Bryobacteraceae bacterium]